MIATSISRVSSNGFYSRRITAFKKAMKEAFPNLTDDDFIFNISADEDGDTINVGIRNVDVDPNIFCMIYNSFFIDELCIKENKTEIGKKQKVFNIIKDLGTDPSFLTVATALVECAQIINS